MKTLAKLYRFLISAVLALFVLLSASHADAQNGPQTIARLIAERGGLDGRDSLVVGLHLKLPAGWHTYWRTPGDAGLPPQLSWDGSENLSSTNIQYPFPERFEADGIKTYGYHDEVVFPFVIKATNVQEPLHLRVSGTVLVCGEMCIPNQISAELFLPSSGGNVVPDDATLLKRWQDRVPEIDGMTITQLSYSDKEITLQIYADRAWQQPVLVVETPINVQVDDKGAGAVSGQSVTWHLPYQQSGVVSEKDKIIFSVKDVLGQKIYATETQKIFKEPVASLNPEQSNIAGQKKNSLWVIFLIAVFGGVILNLMPCVLPVLSLKLLTIMQAQGLEARQIRRGFLATSAGIFASFIILTIAIIGFKAIGVSVGWGIQFQHPVFLALLALVVILFAANLWGYFEIHLPHEAQNRLAMLAHMPQQDLRKDFLSGMLATLLATPCSAPFVGTALSFALGGGSVDVILIFTGLALGLALPFLMIALKPDLVHLLPKPGKWFVTLKHALAFLLLATAAWLLWVMSIQIGVYNALLVFVVLVLLWLSLAFKWRSVSFSIGVAVGVLAILFSVTAVEPVSFVPHKITEQGNWQVFSEALVQERVQAGQVVFVDITASWCLTCQANKLLIINTNEIQDVFKKENIVLLKGDWTNQDDRITAFLKKNNRYGIPFNIVYGPKAPSGIILPELLTKKVLIEAFAKAR